MAILKGLKACVYVAGQVAREYNSDEDLQADGLGNEVTKYVESQEGQEFRIEAGAANSLDNTGVICMSRLAIKFFVDGAFVSYLYADSGTIVPSKGREYCDHGARYLQRFEFSKIKTTEEFPNNPKQLKCLVDSASKLGTISVHFHRVSGLGTSAGDYDHEGLNATAVVPEKALKGSTASHSSKLRSPEVVNPRQSVTCHLMDPFEKPYAVINFKYRSRNALQIEGIIPRDPSPPVDAAASTGGPLAEYSTEDLLRIVRERVKAESPIVKHEGQERGKTLPRDARAKREPDSDVEILEGNSRRNKRTKREVIDLLDD